MLHKKGIKVEERMDDWGAVVEGNRGIMRKTGFV